MSIITLWKDNVFSIDKEWEESTLTFVYYLEKNICDTAF